MKYFVCYILGLGLALILPFEGLSKALVAMAAITITSFVASFKHPFAALAANEVWQKAVLLYLPVMLFGVFTPAAWFEAKWVGLVVLGLSGIIHLASWMNSSDSRRYRLDQFVLGFAPNMPATARLIAMLNGTGRAHEADMIVKALLSGCKPDFSGVSSPLAEKASKEALDL